jgi:hypothetical protein
MIIPGKTVALAYLKSQVKRFSPALLEGRPD